MLEPNQSYRVNVKFEITFYQRYSKPLHSSNKLTPLWLAQTYKTAELLDISYCCDPQWNLDGYLNISHYWRNIEPTKDPSHFPLTGQWSQYLYNDGHLQIDPLRISNLLPKFHSLPEIFSRIFWMAVVTFIFIFDLLNLVLWLSLKPFTLYVHPLRPRYQKDRNKEKERP